MARLLLVPTHQTLTNVLDAFLLGRVRRWIEVVFRQKSPCGQLDADGRPWTRLPAKDLVRQLEREEGVTVSVRRIQRSLARLAEAGYLARQQRGIWKRDFWYSFPDTEWDLQQHRPTAVAKTVTPAKEPSRRQQASVVTGLNLSLSSKNQNLSKTERTRATSSLDGKGVYAAQQAPSTASQGQPHRTSTKGTSQALQRTVQRAKARGFASSEHPTVSSSEPNELHQWVENGFVFTKRLDGLVTKDPVATAPLR